jgi:hypothetical protein
MKMKLEASKCRDKYEHSTHQTHRVTSLSLKQNSTLIRLLSMLCNYCDITAGVSNFKNSNQMTLYSTLLLLSSHALHVSGAYHTHHQELSILYSQTSGVDKTAIGRTVVLAYKIVKDNIKLAKIQSA